MDGRRDAELPPLEQKMSELTVTSERVKAKVTVAGKRLPHALAGLREVSMEASGEVSISPPAAVVTANVLGKSLTIRLVGETIYVEIPSLAARDGGRPWVKEHKRSAGKLFGSGPGLGVEGSGKEPFKEEITLLRSSHDVRSLGTSTVDGQPVTGFAGTVDAHTLEQGQVPAKLRAKIRRLHLKQTGAFEVFIAPTGLPVRTQLTLGIGGARVSVTADLLAINFPLVVQPPPAAETIDAAELEKLEAKGHAKK